MPARGTSLAALLVVGLAVVAAGCGGSGQRGEEIFFVSSRDGDYALFGMDADGSHEGRVTDETGDPSTPAGLLFQVEPTWSPNGQQVAFASGRGGSLDIFVMDSGGERTRRLTSTKAEERHPAWSPDGKRIAFQRDRRLFVMNADGSGARRLTDDRAEEGDPAWSPDGRWLAYERRTSGSPVREIWLVRADGSKRRQLTKLDAVSYAPAWSPDGKTIAFVANPGGARYQIYGVGVDGKGLRPVVRSAEDAFEPAWSPDGKVLAYSSGGSIIALDSAGRGVRLTEASGNDSSPAWRPVAADR